MLDIYVDADGCPVKNEVYRVAARYQLTVFVVANKAMNIPVERRIKMVIVPKGLDVTDDWIAQHIEANDIAITADIPLADRCLKSLKRGARVLGTTGEEFRQESIGSALATRELLSHLREMGQASGGPAPMAPKHRSQFLSKLDDIIQSIRRDASRGD